MSVPCKEILPSILFTCFVAKIVTSKLFLLLCKFHSESFMLLASELKELLAKNQ